MIPIHEQTKKEFGLHVNFARDPKYIHDSMNRPKITFIAYELFPFYYKYLKYRNYLNFWKENSFVFNM